MLLLTVRCQNSAHATPLLVPTMENLVGYQPGSRHDIRGQIPVPPDRPPQGHMDY